MGTKRFNYSLIIFLLICTTALAGELVTAPFHVSGNNGINWQDTHNIGATNVNWQDVKALDTSYGSHSGINWQSFGV